jgi:aminoglycoside 2''-phosphotransferase
LLCDPTEGALIGVIDFGTAGTGDPAQDFGMLINMYGESLVRRLSLHYKGIPDLVERARFYAGQLELFWMLGGLRSGNKSWFAVHLGRARDALPIGSGWLKERYLCTSHMN